MNRNIPYCAIAVAAVASFANTAQAQSVTLYGRVDLGVQYSSKTAASNERNVELANGGILPSIWGFRGTEDLGGGMTAFFNLEAHFAADTGASTGPGAGRLGSGGFRRQANVGLKSELGAITLGRQYSPAILAGLGTEPRGFKENLSGLYPYAFNQNPGGNTVNDLGIFIGNSVSYSNNFGPVYLGAALAAGEGQGKTYALGASYTGPVVLSGAYQKINQAGGGDGDADGTEYGSLGIAVPLGSFKFKYQWQHFEESSPILGATFSEVDSHGLGLDFSWNPSNTLTLAYYMAKDDLNSGDETNTFVISNDYALSKRTTLYVQAAFADAEAGATLRTTVIANGVARGTTSNVFGVGIMHNF